MERTFCGFVMVDQTGSPCPLILHQPCWRAQLQNPHMFRCKCFYPKDLSLATDRALSTRCLHETILKTPDF
jgi:hypothetical protein